MKTLPCCITLRLSRAVNNSMTTHTQETNRDPKPALDPGACSAIVWLAERYESPDACLYPNPIGAGWCCELGIRSEGINRTSTAATNQDACMRAAEIVARELG